MRKILVIGPETWASEALEAIEGLHVEVLRAREEEEALPLVNSADIVVLDASSGGFSALDEIRARSPRSYVIAAPCNEGMDAIVSATKKGVFDCISKPSIEDLASSIREALQDLDLHSRLKSMERADYRANDIVGKSRAMEAVFRTIAIASESKVTILIQGESGTGKELIARAIHANGAGRDKPFVAINCSALVETLLESELFGHEKGAFTGALFKKEGKFEAASGGTVFLDEIGEMSQALQVKLLRVLQERSFERVGGSDTIKTDVRVIAATNRDLSELTSRGLFREDLYYRLKVITIEAPPLRERKEDIPLLVAHTLEKANRELKKDVRKVPESLLELMTEYPWPGNVRELENVITRGVLLARGDVLLDVRLDGRPAPQAEGAWRPARMSDIERAHIERTLLHERWNKSRAALLLGMTIPRLNRKIRKYSIANPGKEPV
ncbi:MAG: sigma-54-dependent Fis family transcriptional regulator [Deltaproteobacteria bacterium]|nr:sigma-54-dependent Fis family transcriptional regulator [Deltaproteobacteria bacterium]